MMHGQTKIKRHKILIFIYPIYNHNWRNISTIYTRTFNKTSIKRNILSIKQNTPGSRSGEGLISTSVLHRQSVSLFLCQWNTVENL